MASEHERRRTGSVFLYVIVLALVLLTGWALTSASVTTSARVDTVSAVQGDLCQMLADSAVADLEAQVGAAINRPSSPLFKELRALKDSEVELGGYLDRRAIDALLKEPQHQGCTLVSTRCRIAFHRPLDVLPDERAALLVWTATVRWQGAGRGVTRTVEVARWAKLALVTAPRPFGDYGIFIGNATGLSHAPRANQARRRLEERARRLLLELRQLVPAADPRYRPRWQKVLSGAFDPDLPNAMPAEVKPFDDAVFYGLLQRAEKQALLDLDVARDLEDQVMRVDEVVRRLDAAKVEIGTAAPGIAEPLLETASTAARTTVDALFRLWNYHAKFNVLTPGDGDIHPRIREQLYKLQPHFFWSRSSLRVFGEPATLQAQLDRYLARGVSGVVWVDNPAGTPITLSGSPAGRVLIAAGPGGVTIRELCAQPGDTGLVTVYARSGPVRVQGRNQVSLLVGPPSRDESPPRLEIDSSAQVRGALVIDTLRPGTALSGAWQREMRQASGDGAQDAGIDVSRSYFVTVSPRVHFRRVTRE